jgi:resuscitation-promoting factor RpfB
MNLNHSPWDPESRRFSLPPLPVWRLLTWHAPQGLIALVAMTALALAMVWGYVQSLATVRVVVDGTIRTIRTNQVTVAAVLRDADVKLYPEDRVSPLLYAPVEDGEAIRVEHARPVVVNVDGRMIQARSLKSAPADILADLGIRLSPHDKLVVDGQTVEAAAPGTVEKPTTTLLSTRASRDTSSSVPRNITVLRAVEMTVRSNDAPPVTLHTTASTVGEAVRQAGMTLYLADTVQPDLGTPAQAGQVVTIDRAVPLTIEADGRHLHTRTHSKTAADALAEAGIALEGQDYSVPVPSASLKPDITIRVVRVAETFRIEQEPVPFEIQWMPDPEMEIDNQDLKQAGENGVLQKRIRVRYEDGLEVSRRLEDSGIIRPPKTKVITYGTKIVIRTMETPDGPVEYWRKLRMLATSYSASTAGTPKTAKYYGRTALGWVMRFGIVAVDPRVVKLGSRVYVFGYGVGDAGDTGGAIKGKRIDLGYDDDDPRVWTWHRWTDVYLLTPVPDNVSYVVADWPQEP